MHVHHIKPSYPRSLRVWATETEIILPSIMITSSRVSSCFFRSCPTMWPTSWRSIMVRIGGRSQWWTDCPMFRSGICPCTETTRISKVGWTSHVFSYFWTSIGRMSSVRWLPSNLRGWHVNVVLLQRNFWTLATDPRTSVSRISARGMPTGL